MKTAASNSNAINHPLLAFEHKRYYPSSPFPYYLVPPLATCPPPPLSHFSFIYLQSIYFSFSTHVDRYVFVSSCDVMILTVLTLIRA